MNPGKLLLFIHEDFKDYERRNGADADIKVVRDCFKDLRFDVMDTFRNYSTDEVFAVLKKERNAKINFNCLFIIIITHSEFHGQLLSKDGKYTDQDVINYFTNENCPELVLIPKYFIFQASNATKKAIEYSTADSNDKSHFYLPMMANIFIIRSLFELSESGSSDSYFLKTLCLRMKNFNEPISSFDIFTDILLDLKTHRDLSVTSLKRNYLLPEITSTQITITTTTLKEVSDKNNPRESNKTTYKNHKKLGKLYVFNYNSVYCSNRRGPLFRPGTEYDREAIKKTFSALGFDVIINNDLRKEEALSVLKNAEDFSNDTCVAVAIMTHGSEENMLTADYDLTEREFIGQLSTRKETDLFNKPIIYFMQVCRGKNTPGNVKVSLDDDGTHSVTPCKEVSVKYITPNKTTSIDYDDVIIFHSTYWGYTSKRPKDGSPFIQTLCKQIDKAIKKNTTISLVDVLQDVQNDVINAENGHEKQMPVIHSTLTKKLLLINHD